MKQITFNCLCIVLLFLSTISNSYAQQRTCGSTIEQWNKIKQTSYYKQVLRDHALRLQQGKTAGINCSNDTFMVPVVVHIVYHTADENITDEQVQSQIDAINEDYAIINATSMDIPAAWQQLKKDSKIRFCLAKRNPQSGNTNGITRTQTALSVFSFQDISIKYSNLGGQNAWPSSSYLNIWVCNLDPYLGYAAFPGTIPEEDGLVINYQAFGRTGANRKKKYNLGRTVTHEVGHWFGLLHVWGNSDDCSDDDGINDTPLQASSTFGSPKYPKYDNCTSNGDGIMFTNYMDYSDDKVMMFFTPDQISEMDTTIQSDFRDSICNSMGCILPFQLSQDLELEEIISPVTTSEQRCFQPIVRVRNNGLDSATHFQLVYNIDSGEKRLYQWTGILLSGNAVDVTLPNIAGVDGLNIIEARILEEDSNTVNNYRSRSYKVTKENTAGCDDCAPVIYPNPVTTNSFCVKSCFITSDKLTIRVLNMLGQKIIEEKDIDSNPGDVFPINLAIFLL